MLDKLIIYSDDDLLIANKPPRLLTTPVEGMTEESLLDVLRDGGQQIQAVHRLDRDTTGLVIFTRHRAAEVRMTKLMSTRQIQKQYQALAQGWVTPKSGELTLSIRDLGASACISRSGKPARTVYTTARRIGPCSLLNVNIKTGRHNQIRLHFAHMGHPLVGERKFALGKWGLVPHRRVLLHASRLVIPATDGGKDLVITAPLPDDFQRGIEAAERTPCAEDPGNMSSDGLFTTERRLRHRQR
jgi:RluA family pseudouridine synthase